MQLFMMTSIGYIKTNRIARYLNPIVRLGIRKYSVLFPLTSMLGMAVVLELFASLVLHDPEAVGAYAILVFLAAIIYFAFRDGVKGGFTAVTITLGYYLYIIFSRQYQGERLVVGIQTTLVLGILYLAIAAIIGWLKQTIDRLIEQETAARLSAEDGHLRLRAILQQLPVGVMTVNATDLIVEANKRAEVILGVKKRTHLSNDESPKYNRVYKNEQKLLVNQWPIVRALKTGEIVIGEEMTYHRQDGKKLEIRVSASPIRNAKKAVIGAVSTVFDITAEKEQEQRKNDFVNMASHELKTPITSMKLYVDSLYSKIKTGSDERSLKMITGIKNQTEKLQELVNDLLDVTRIQTGKLHFNKEVFNLSELLNETIEVLQETTSQHQIMMANNATFMIYGDRFRIYQVVTNLITNAIKYSPDGTKIVVRARQEGLKVIVSVQDFGIGIAKVQRKKIFERLYQVNDSTQKTYPGLGMGLYISKEIIKRHRGTIWVEGTVGKGSTFYFSLPVKKN